MTPKSTPSPIAKVAPPMSAFVGSVEPVALQSAKIPSVPPASAPLSSSKQSSGTFAAGEPEIISADSGHCVGCYEGVLICVWRDAPTLAAIETVRATFTAMSEARPGGAGVLGVAEEGMPTIGALERRIVSDLLTDLGRRCLFVAAVVEGEGLWASTARSVMTAIGIVAHRPCPMKTFRYPAEAAAWQARFATGASASSLTEAIQRCREQMGPRA